MKITQTVRFLDELLLALLINDGTASDAGHERVYSLCSTSSAGFYLLMIEAEDKKTVIR